MRYPMGFRHLESFNQYAIKYPKSNVQDYHKEMNREVNFEEFRKMFVDHIREEIEHNILFMH